MADDLGLTQEQREKAKKVNEEGRVKIKPLMDKMHTLRKEVDTIRRANTDATTKKVTAKGQETMKPLTDEIAKLRKEVAAVRRANMTEFEKILTAEQKTKFDTLKKAAPKHAPKGKKVAPKAKK